MPSSMEHDNGGKTRRGFLGLAAKAAMGGAAAGVFPGLIGKAWGRGERYVAPRGTDRSTLVNRNPAEVDARNLEITPLERFETMGISDHQVEVSQWRLEVKGEVATPLSLTYEEVLHLPVLEQEVLLICPGFFAVYGRWKGISVAKLLRSAGASPRAGSVVFRGPNSRYASVKSFPWDDIKSDKVFLAHAVNGRTLPVRHGFPLRVVARDYYGYDWVKYVYRMEVV